MNRTFQLCFFLLGGVVGCSAPPVEKPAPIAEAMEEPVLKGGIPIPAAVRENLGIAFVEVERRAIASTRRVPGVFELRPEATREYRALLAGRVQLHVAQFEVVESGTLLLTLNAPQWRQLQHEAVEAEGEIVVAEASRDVVRARQQEAAALLQKSEARLENLRAAGARNAALEAESTALRTSIPRIAAELAAQEAAVREAHEHYESRLRTLASITGIPIAELLASHNGEAAWRAIDGLEIRATGPGTVDTLAVNDGGWIQEGGLALSTIDTRAIRFHAEAPQSDIVDYAGGQQARIVPPQGSSIPLEAGIGGTLTVGPTAHAADRTFSLYLQPAGELPPWAREGMTAFLEVTLSSDAEEAWAIPKSAVIQDGLEHVFFRRDPTDPDRALRVVADLGEDDGRWIALKSGVKKGDEVVLEGAYALKLTGAAQQAPEGYHFHADGALHKNH